MADKAFDVDLDGLDALAGRLETLAASFTPVDQSEDFSAAQVGHATALEALRRFTSGWKDGRKRIKGRSEDAAALLNHAAQGYRAVEDSLVESMGSPASDPGTEAA